MNVYRLDNPWGLLFLIIPVFCVSLLLLGRIIFKKGVKISGVSGFQKSLSLAMLGYFTAMFLLILGMFLIAFSLSKPQYGLKKEKIISEGIDIMIALDVSGSMITKDFLEQSRIEGAKKILQKFIDKRKGDRIGLVTFAESSFLRCPATLNFPLLKSVIERITINPNKQSSTAIGIGLASAINRLIKLKDNTKPASKIIILVTDGINNSGEITPQAALEIAEQSEIKVYSIGVGGSYEVDIDLLKSISDRTKGKFFHAKTSGDFGTIFDEIDKLEKHKIETMQYTRFKDIGFIYAVMGIIAMLAGLFMNTLFFKRLG